MKAIVLFTCMCLVFSARAAHTGQDSILLKIDKYTSSEQKRESNFNIKNIDDI